MLEQNALKECWIRTEAEQLFCSSWFHMVRQGGLRFTGKNYFLGCQQKGLQTVALVDDLCYLPQRVYRCNSVSGKKSNNILIYVLFQNLYCFFWLHSTRNFIDHLSTSPIFHAGTLRFHAGLGPVDLYVATPLLITVLFWHVSRHQLRINPPTCNLITRTWNDLKMTSKRCSINFILLSLTFAMSYVTV